MRKRLVILPDAYIIIIDILDVFMPNCSVIIKSCINHYMLRVLLKSRVQLCRAKRRAYLRRFVYLLLSCYMLSKLISPPQKSVDIFIPVGLF